MDIFLRVLRIKSLDATKAQADELGDALVHARQLGMGKDWDTPRRRYEFERLANVKSRLLHIRRLTQADV